MQQLFLFRGKGRCTQQAQQRNQATLSIVSKRWAMQSMIAANTSKKVCPKAKAITAKDMNTKRTQISTVRKLSRGPSPLVAICQQS
eukprot:4155344-Amphidinium_carterae.1